ncbi:MAG: response regulator transcription factor [Acidimicrobiales bacterium]|nr:response regulator transcription factor [Acidimicrobiales bacterium]
MSGTGNGDVATVLVVDDDRAVRESLDRALRLEGYRVMMASDGLALFDVIEATPPDLIVLDVMMPNVDGITACRRLRDRGDRTPILILTARDAVSDRVAGLDAGADDYLPKPFALEELLARTRALLRRNAPDEDAAELVVDDLRLDARRREVHRGERLLELTKTEFDLLELLMHNDGIVLSRELIYERIWGYDFGTTSKSLEVYVGYLRRKTEEAGEPRLIHTVRGVGYVLRAGT